MCCVSPQLDLTSLTEMRTLRKVQSTPWEFLMGSGVSLTLGPESGVQSSTNSGLGGVSAPLVAQIVIAKGIPWPQFYYGSMVISGLNFAFLLLMYRPTENELLEERRVAAKKKDYFSGVHYSQAKDGASLPAAALPVASRPQQSMMIHLFDIKSDECRL